MIYISARIERGEHVYRRPQEFTRGRHHSPLSSSWPTSWFQAHQEVPLFRMSSQIQRLNVTFPGDTPSCRRPLIGPLAEPPWQPRISGRDFAPTANRIEKTRKRQSYNSVVAEGLAAFFLSDFSRWNDGRALTDPFRPSNKCRRTSVLEYFEDYAVSVSLNKWNNIENRIKWQE